VLDNTWFRLPAAQRFSYNYRGRSQVLDHILASPDLSARLVGFNPLRFNSDFPENPYQSQSAIPWFTSDHDPLAATFAQADLFLHPLYLPQVSRQN
jgi:predicted extracellular nuclease